MRMGLGHISLPYFLVVLAIMLSIGRTGELLAHRFFSESLKDNTCLVFLMGFGATTLGLMALVLGGGISPVTALCLMVTIVSAFSVATHPLKRRLSHTSMADLTVIALAAVIISWHGRFAMSAPVTLRLQELLPTWSDYYLHSETISSFGSRFALGGDIEVALASRPFYHYGTFLIPAAVQEAANLSGLSLATSLLLPFGLLIAALGCYALAIEIGGRLSGLLAVTLLTTLPIPSSYLLRCGWYDFYWLLFISPGTGYGLGIACGTCALIAAYAKDRKIMTLAASAVLAISLAVIRIQFFMLLAPTISLLVISCWKPRLAACMFGAALVGALSGILTLAYSDNLRQGWESLTSATQYLDFSLKWSPPAQRLIESTHLTGWLSSLGFKVALSMLSILGAWALLYPVFLTLHVRKNGLKTIDLLFLFSILVFIFLLLLAPAATHGDSSEYKHRHFPFIYALNVIFISCYVAKFSSAHIVFNQRYRKFLAGLCCVLLISSGMYSRNIDQGKADESSMPWARDLQYRRTKPGLLEASDFIRNNSIPGDVFATGVVAASAFAPDSAAVQIIALTGIPSFMTRSTLKMTGSDCIKGLTTTRMSILNKVEYLTTINEVYTLLRASYIRWYVAMPDQRLSWDPDRTAAVFSKEGFSVYDVGRSVAPSPLRMACS